jgi:hypothetical protein
MPEYTGLGQKDTTPEDNESASSQIPVPESETVTKGNMAAKSTFTETLEFEDCIKGKQPQFSQPSQPRLPPNRYHLPIATRYIPRIPQHPDIPENPNLMRSPDKRPAVTFALFKSKEQI